MILALPACAGVALPLVFISWSNSIVTLHEIPLARVTTARPISLVLNALHFL